MSDLNTIDEVVIEILWSHDKPLHYDEITEKTLADGRSGLGKRGGKTPSQTVGAVLRDYPDMIEQLGQGEYQLTREGRRITAARKINDIESDQRLFTGYPTDRLESRRRGYNEQAKSVRQRAIDDRDTYEALCLASERIVLQIDLEIARRERAQPK